MCVAPLVNIEAVVQLKPTSGHINKYVIEVCKYEHITKHSFF